MNQSLTKKKRITSGTSTDPLNRFVHNRFPTIQRTLLDEELKKHLSLLSGKKVLDIGGATSPYRQFISAKEYVTLDLNTDHDPDIVGDVHALPIKDNCFDAILATELLEHCPDPFKAVAEMHRVLKPKGIIIASSPFIYQYHGDEFSRDYWRFSKDGWAQLFKDFNKTNLFGYGYLSTAIATLITTRFFFLNRLSPILSRLRLWPYPQGHVIVAFKK